MNRTTNKCYARGCDNNNPDNTCMYGYKKFCHVNCNNCIYDCKKTTGDIACARFKRVKDSNKNG